MSIQSQILAENEKLMKFIEQALILQENEKLLDCISLSELIEPEEEEPEEEKDIMDLYPAELKELLDYNHVDVEIRERIYKDFNEIKMVERKVMGWNELNNDIEKAPFCEKVQRITKVCYCCNCTSCRINGCCYECIKKG